MSTWLPQTKRAKDDMESLGLKWRDDFTVETPFDHKLKGYGRTRVWLCSRQDNVLGKAVAVADEIAAMGYHVRMLIVNDQVDDMFIEENSDCEVERIEIG